MTFDNQASRLSAQPVSREKMYHSHTLQRSFKPDVESTFLLRSIKLPSTSGVPEDKTRHLVRDSETVGLLTAAQLSRVLQEQEDSFNLQNSQRQLMKKLPWFSQLKQVSLIVGDNPQSLEIVDLISAREDNGQIILQVARHQEFLTETTGHPENGVIAASETGVAVVHQRSPSPAYLGFDNRNLSELTLPAAQPVRVVTDNIFLRESQKL
jgi:hypothetical protein